MPKPLNGGDGVSLLKNWFKNTFQTTHRPTTELEYIIIALLKNPPTTSQLDRYSRIKEREDYNVIYDLWEKYNKSVTRLNEGPAKELLNRIFTEDSIVKFYKQMYNILNKLVFCLNELCCENREVQSQLRPCFTTNIENLSKLLSQAQQQATKWRAEDQSAVSSCKTILDEPISKLQSIVDTFFDSAAGRYRTDMEVKNLKSAEIAESSRTFNDLSYNFRTFDNALTCEQNHINEFNNYILKWQKIKNNPNWHLNVVTQNWWNVVVSVY